MATSIQTIREDTQRTLRQSSLYAAVICLAIASLSALTISDSLPAVNGNSDTTDFVSGLALGIVIVAAVMTIARCVQLRRALTSDQELRRFYAKEHDELAECVRRDTASEFVRIQPLLGTIAIIVAAFVGEEALMATAATVVLFSVTLVACKFVCKHRYADGGED